MNSSPSIAALAAAMTKAQPTVEGAIKDRVNPAFRSKYADLGAVVDAIRDAIATNDLAYVQVVHQADAAAAVETIILHKSGEWLSCGVCAVPVTKHDAQGFGSAMTYARRYSLSAAFGVAPEDDDGNAAAKAAPKREEPKAEMSPAPSPDLLLLARNAANAGTEKYAAFWRSLTSAERHAIGGSRHADFKAMAADGEAVAA